MLIDIMPDHNREVDDLDYLLRDALWSSDDAAPDPVRMLAGLRARIWLERQRALMPAFPTAPAWASPNMLASYWYFMPLLRVLR
jgi:hypothetical protein